MNTDKSFRIKSLIGEEATCWPISPFRLSVFWESGVHEFWTPEDLEDMIAHFGWEKLPSEDELPRTFKFKCHPDFGDKITYTYNGNTRQYYNPEREAWYPLSQEYVEKAILEGEYIVLPFESDGKIAVATNTISSCLPDGPDTIGYVPMSFDDEWFDVLQAIKAFTSGTGHDVFISEGIYKVYRRDEDTPYVCTSDAELINVMDALIMLDAAEG